MDDTHWDPARYSLFGDERRRPAVDLIARLPKPSDGFRPDHIVDLGCGPGNVTADLARTFTTPDHRPKVTGIDHSAEMLEKAKSVGSGLDITWQREDIAKWQPDEPVDLIFSNAALHWVPNHSALYPRLCSFLRPGGILAVQVPNNFLAPSHQLIAEAGEDWRDAVAEAQGQMRIMRPGDYYDVLAQSCDDIDLWQTQYCHVLRGEDPVFNWVSSTALRPVLAALPDDEARQTLCEKYKKRLSQVYPPRPDGITLFPFNRLFMIAIKR
jgi:trans-aconitate 2-methyltransferase